MPTSCNDSNSLTVVAHVPVITSQPSTPEQQPEVTGQNGSGQNGTDKMVWTKWYTDKMLLDKMVWTKWYGQNGSSFQNRL